MRAFLGILILSGARFLEFIDLIYNFILKIIELDLEIEIYKMKIRDWNKAIY